MTTLIRCRQGSRWGDKPVRVDLRILPAVAAGLVVLGGCAVRTETSNIVGGGDGWLSPSGLLSPGGLVAVVTLAGFLISLFFNIRWLGRIHDYEAEIENGPVVIFTAVNAKLEAALRAHGPAAITAAHELVDCVELYLGPVLAFTKDVGKPFDQLRKALTGKVKTTEGPKIKVDHHHPAGAAAAAAASAGAAGGAAASVAVAGTHVAVESPPSPPPPPPPPNERDASTQEQIVEVRLAVEAFARVWTRASIEQKLKQAQTSLRIKEAICVPTKVEDPCAPKTGPFGGWGK
jgi:hypothetical protein